MVKRYSLTDKQRQQILSAYDAGWGYSKIARIVECTPKEVRAVVLANRPEAHPPGEYMHAYAKLREVFGDEFDKLSNTDAALVGRDYLEAIEEENIDSQEYARRIGRGNLQSYAEVMRVRAQKGWNKNPRGIGRKLVPTKIGDLQSVGATIRKNREGEYVVRLWQNGKHYAPADYFTNDADDAVATAQDMVMRASKPRKNPHVKGRLYMDKKTGGTVYDPPHSVEARELFQYIVQDGDLYRQQGQPIILNLRRKIKRGVYKPELAVKLWRYYADSGAKKYTFEHGSPQLHRTMGRAWHGGNWHDVKGFGIFTVPMRNEVARELFDYYSGDVFANTTMKKNPLSVPRKGAYSGPRTHVRSAVASAKLSALQAGKNVYVQQKRGPMWFTLAVSQNTAKGIALAKTWAERFHRKHPGTVMRLFV